MRLVSYPRSFFCVTRHAPVELSPKAQMRLGLLQARRRLCQNGMSWAEAVRVLGVSRARPVPLGEATAAGRAAGAGGTQPAAETSAPALWSEELVEAVRRLRHKYPRWGKETLAVLLKRREQLKDEPPRGWVTVRKRRLRRPYAQRKPREYAVEKAGDLVQVDTMDVRPLPGVVFKHLTARDTVSRWDVVQAHPRATSRAAAQFVDSLLARMPFRVQAIQVDGGSEFCGESEQACARRNVRLFVLPPRSPKLNARVERAHRTHAEEFYDLYTGPLDMRPASIAICVSGEPCTTRSDPTDCWTSRRRPSIFASTTPGWPGSSDCLISLEPIPRRVKSIDNVTGG